MQVMTATCAVSDQRQIIDRCGMSPAAVVFREPATRPNIYISLHEKTSSPEVGSMFSGLLIALQADLAILDDYVQEGLDIIIFTPTKKQCNSIWELLKKRYASIKDKITIAHSDLSDDWLQHEIGAWKSGAYHVMISTSVISNVCCLCH
jgi:superfamily II DNA helicase RecQ